MGDRFIDFGNAGVAAGDVMSDATTMTKKTVKIERPAILAVEDLLEYRLPQSRKPLSAIVLTREVAERLVKEWYALEGRVANLTTDKGT